MEQCLNISLIKINMKKVITSTNKNRQHQDSQQQKNDKDSITEKIKKAIAELKDEGFKSYAIRDLVNHAEEFGNHLRKERLETNQVRKFLDALNRIKADLADKTFTEIEPDVVLLKPKLAYAAARQRAAKPLSDVMSDAIDKVRDIKDFERLVQFIESIIAYHKAAGGK